MRDIVVYKCTVCDREVQLLRNIKSIETVGHCIITANCRGRLYIEHLIQTTEPFLTRTEEVVGLNNFFPRAKLFKFTQQFDKEIWYIRHNLAAFPLITAYDTNGVLIPDNKFTLTVIDENIVELDFNALTSGTAELYIREAPVMSIVPSVAPSDAGSLQVSTNITLGTIAVLTTEPRSVTKQVFEDDGITPLLDDNNQPVFENEPDSMRLKFTAANGNTQFNNVDITTNNSNSPWSGTRRIVIRNRTYYVGFVNIYSNGFNQALISNGTGISIESSDMGISHILLADIPFDNIDRIEDRILEINKINMSIGTLFFDNNEIFCDNAAITKIYPNLIIS